MIPRNAGHERVYRGLLRLYPADFRARFANEMVQLFGDQLRDARTGGASLGSFTIWLRTLGDLAVTATSERARRDRTVAHSLSAPPSSSSRVLGAIGILGGGILVAAFFDFIPWGPDLFNLRLVLFNAGAMAIVVAVHRRQVSAAPRLALLAAVPAFLANAWYLIMIVRVVAQPGPPGSGDFGPNFDLAAIALWLTDAWFGIVTFRLRIVSRWAALAVGVGSFLAFGGMNRLGLTSEANPTIFGPLSLLGIALAGIGWILLGIDVATRRRPLKAHESAPPEVRPGG